MQLWEALAVVVAHLEQRVLRRVAPVVAGAGRLERQIVGDTRHAHPGTDIRAVLDGYVSISPLDTAMVHEEHHRQLAAAADALTAQLRGRIGYRR